MQSSLRKRLRTWTPQLIGPRPMVPRAQPIEGVGLPRWPARLDPPVAARASRGSHARQSVGESLAFPRSGDRGYEATTIENHVSIGRTWEPDGTGEGGRRRSSPPPSGHRTAPQVRQPPGPQTRRQFVEPLPGRREEPAQEATQAELLQPPCHCSALVPRRSRISATSRDTTALPLPSRNSRAV